DAAAPGPLGPHEARAPRLRGDARGAAPVSHPDPADPARERSPARPAAPDLHLLLLARDRLVRPVRRPVSPRPGVALRRAADRPRRHDPGAGGADRGPAPVGRIDPLLLSLSPPPPPPPTSRAPDQPHPI